jgi:hypothetical protein
MSVRTYDPKTPEIFKSGLCSAGCGKEYFTICRYCNLAYCFEHIKLKPHACDTKVPYTVPTREEAGDVLVAYGDEGEDQETPPVNGSHA